ncbi:hypothetical protein E5288_WYG002418 [Bos mutus]|uniref:Uncharacterized protein n=1 Tax=Bos mutus TaxID=72004 RepID=A0A6B0R1N3_9CETA|nr:hypothetical protein [Bos mutus]
MKRKQRYVVMSQTRNNFLYFFDFSLLSTLNIESKLALLFRRYTSEIHSKKINKECNSDTAESNVKIEAAFKSFIFCGRILHNQRKNFLFIAFNWFFWQRAPKAQEDESELDGEASD